VAGFLGVSNLLDGDIVGNDGTWVDVRLADGATVRVPAERVNGAHAVRVGVRPEKLRVVPADSESAGRDPSRNSLGGTVLDASYIGVSTQYLIETRDGHRLVVYAQNLETSGAAEALADGQQVHVSWKPQHTFVIEASEHVHEAHSQEETDSDE
jgi:spermidine/putrescine transport system ATP-binding protein